MKNFNMVFYIITCSLLLQLHSFQSRASDQATLGDGIDCTEVTVKYSKDPNLTQRERIRLMDQAFQESLNKFEFCQSIKSKKKIQGVDGAAGGDGHNQGVNDLVGKSIASATMSGTEKQKLPSAADKGEARTSSELIDPQQIDEISSKDIKGVISPNGKAPEDIPSAGNDDNLAAQIRYAAENETDPVKKKQLWNEYRKYKGLPVKN